MALVGLALLLGCAPEKPVVVFEGEVTPNHFGMRRYSSQWVDVFFKPEAPSDFSVEFVEDVDGGMTPREEAPTAGFTCRPGVYCVVTIESHSKTAFTSWRLTLATPTDGRSTMARATVFFRVEP